MEKKENLALIGAVSAVLLLIFIMTKIRGTDAEPSAGGASVEPGEVIQTGASETDIWDVLHAMNETEPDSGEGNTVAVTAIDDNGDVYTVTDEQGNVQTEIVPAAEPAADTPDESMTETETVQENERSADTPVINVTPGQQKPEDVQPGEPYFVVIPADE